MPGAVLWIGCTPATGGGRADRHARGGRVAGAGPDTILGGGNMHPGPPAGMNARCAPPGTARGVRIDRGLARGAGSGAQDVPPLGSEAGARPNAPGLPHLPGPPANGARGRVWIPATVPRRQLGRCAEATPCCGGPGRWSRTRGNRGRIPAPTCAGGDDAPGGR